MDQPLGAAVGNALEVREALDTVRGRGPADFTELVLDACARLLALSDLGIDEAEGRRRAEAAVADGCAEAMWHRWIEAQGGDPRRGRASRGAGRARGDRSPARATSRARRDRVGNAAAPSRRRAPHEGGRDRPRRRRRVPREARRRWSRPGERLAEVHARDDASAAEAVERGARRLRDRRRRRRRAAGAARGRRLTASRTRHGTWHA